MQAAALTIEILILIGMIIFGFYIKTFLPSYLGKKGENMATKEDIAEITRRTAEVQKDFNEKFELFSGDVQFKKNFYFKQYSDLYCKLYSIIIQSEYVRLFIKKHDETDIRFDDAPFIEISPSKLEEMKIDIKQGEPVKTFFQQNWIDTPISQFDKKTLCDTIIQNGSLSSQELLKEAVSYRFAYNYYSGNKDAKNTNVSETANAEELRLIRDMVCRIVKDYNKLRRDLGLTYSEKEIVDGIPRL